MSDTDATEASLVAPKSPLRDEDQDTKDPEKTQEKDEAENGDSLPKLVEPSSPADGPSSSSGALAEESVPEPKPSSAPSSPERNDAAEALKDVVDQDKDAALYDNDKDTEKVGVSAETEASGAEKSPEKDNDKKNAQSEEGDAESKKNEKKEKRKSQSSNDENEAKIKAASTITTETAVAPASPPLSEKPAVLIETTEGTTAPKTVVQKKSKLLESMRSNSVADYRSDGTRTRSGSVSDAERAALEAMAAYAKKNPKKAKKYLDLTEITPDSNNNKRKSKLWPFSKKGRSDSAGENDILPAFEEAVAGTPHALTHSTPSVSDAHHSDEESGSDPENGSALHSSQETDGEHTEPEKPELRVPESEEDIIERLKKRKMAGISSSPQPRTKGQKSDILAQASASGSLTSKKVRPTMNNDNPSSRSTGTIESIVNKFGGAVRSSKKGSASQRSFVIEKIDTPRVDQFSSSSPEIVINTPQGTISSQNTGSSPSLSSSSPPHSAHSSSSGSHSDGEAQERSVSPSRISTTSSNEGFEHVPHIKLTQREMVLKEIVLTEREYVNDLKTIIEVFLIPLRESGLVSLPELQGLFGNIEVIYSVNGEVLDMMSKRVELKGFDILVGDLFLQLSEYLKLYTMYCINQEASTRLYKQLIENPAFEEFVLDSKKKEVCRKLSLLDFGIKPMQRLCKYPLLLRELLRNTEPDHEDFSDITKAFDQISEVVKYVNDRKRVGENQQKIIDIQYSIEGCPKILEASRRFIRDSFVSTMENKQKHKRHLFLFNDMVIIAKPHSSLKIGRMFSDYDHQSKYTFVDSFSLKHVKIVDFADTEDYQNAFELEHKFEEKKHLITVETAEEKREWIKDIKRIVKEHQRAEYLANKDKLIQESEDRESRRKAFQSLNRMDANPKDDDFKDVWVLGLVLYNSYTRKPLFDGLNLSQTAIALMTRTFQPSLKEEDGFPPELAEIIQDCWLPNEDSRPSYGMIYDRIRALEMDRPSSPTPLSRHSHPSSAPSSSSSSSSEKKSKKKNS